MTTPIVIAGLGAVCPVGNGVRQVDASVRAGLGVQADATVINRSLEPMTLALVNDDLIEPLAPGIDESGWRGAQVRMIRLAGPALRECLSTLPVGGTPGLFVGLPEPDDSKPIDARELAVALAAQVALPVQLSESHVVPGGRAAALRALEDAMDALARGRLEWAIVGGIDTHLDLARLGRLDATGRLLGPRVLDGFVPGEGAAFALLTTRAIAERHRLDAPITIRGVASAADAGCFYGTEPARGEGLSVALDQLRSAAGPQAPIAKIYGGLNGEHFFAKDWGVARIRHAPAFQTTATLEHPADCYGDAGAATGMLLLVLAERALRRAGLGPTLVWAASDRGLCACALLSA